MSNEVPMICATSVMKPGRARIGKIGGNLTLPRTVPIVTLAASGVGAFLGLVLALAIGEGSTAVAMGLGLGGGAGWMAVTYSPLKNESLAKWVELQVRSQTRARYIHGKRVTLAVGVGVVTGPSSGPVLLRRSAVRVPAGQYDDRGTPTARQRSGASLVGDLDVVDLSPVGGSSPLPLDTTAGRSFTQPARRRPVPSARPAAAPTDVTDPLAGPAHRLKD